MSEQGKIRRLVILLVIALVLVLAGGSLASAAQTAGGTVKI